MLIHNTQIGEIEHRPNAVMKGKPNDRVATVLVVHWHLSSGRKWVSRVYLDDIGFYIMYGNVRGDFEPETIEEIKGLIDIL